jgi:uncharacterized protein YlxW (UPF0749 family)
VSADERPDRVEARRSWLRRRPRFAVLVPVVALAAGLLFATSARTSDGHDLRAGRRSQLTELISEQRSEVSGLERRASGLRDDVDRRSAEAAGRDARVAAERGAGDRLAFAAGTTPVRGPAVTVSLDDAPPGTESDDPNDLVVHQQDVQAVVNALWNGGAEGMTLMGQRVISTSAVRCVGNTVLLHGRVYGPPFVVTAIGDRASLRAALATEPGVRLFGLYVDRFGLGYDVTEQEDVVLPAYDGPLDLPSSTSSS